MEKQDDPYIVEKTLFALLVGLLLLYGAVQYYASHSLIPELKNINEVVRDTRGESPRNGKIIPLSDYARHLAAGQKFFIPNEFPNQKSEVQDQYPDLEKINYFAPGIDEQKRAANSYLIGFKPFDTEKYWLPLVAVGLRLRYLRDDAFSNDVLEEWQTSKQAYRNMRGDCEDHAILLADWLIELGYDARVVMGKYKKGAHAWVVLFKDGKEYLLEATDKASRKKYPLVALQTEYEPFYMFNKDYFWFRDRTGSRYSREIRWAKVSQFIAS